MPSINDLKREMASARAVAEKDAAKKRTIDEKRQQDKTLRLQRVREMVALVFQPSLSEFFADQGATIQLHQECDEKLNEHNRRNVCTVKALVSATFLHPRHAKDDWSAKNVRVGFGYYGDDVVCFVKTSHASPAQVTIVTPADPDCVAIPLQAHDIDLFTRETADAMLSGVVGTLLGKDKVGLIIKMIR